MRLVHYKLQEVELKSVLILEIMKLKYLNKMQNASST
jgi:hypothetical protein